MKIIIELPEDGYYSTLYCCICKSEEKIHNEDLDRLGGGKYKDNHICKKCCDGLLTKEEKDEERNNLYN